MTLWPAAFACRVALIILGTCAVLPAATLVSTIAVAASPRGRSRCY